MPDTDQQPLHEVVRTLLGLRTLLHGHTGAWWALGQELDTRYGQEAVEAEFKRQLDVRHGYVEDIRRPVKPKPPHGRILMESDPPWEAGAQRCHDCNGTGEVQGEWQGGSAGLETCLACNGEGTVAQ